MVEAGEAGLGDGSVVARALEGGEERGSTAKECMVAFKGATAGVGWR